MRIELQLTFIDFLKDRRLSVAGSRTLMTKSAYGNLRDYQKFCVLSRFINDCPRTDLRTDLRCEARSRKDLAFEHIENLRQLIQGRAAQEAADGQANATCVSARV